jgi:hypothetical protein
MMAGVQAAARCSTPQRSHQLLDVVLQSGDVVFVQSRKMDVFCTGGLLPPGEHILPNN